MTQSFTCYSVYLFIIWFEISCVQCMCTLLVLSRVANFTWPGYIKMQGPCIIAFWSNLRPQFLYVLYLHWSPNPKCCLVPIKPSGPHIFKASTRSLEPVYYDVAPHAVVLLQTLPPHSSLVFFKRTREKPICSGGAFKKRICSGDPYLRVP